MSWSAESLRPLPGSPPDSWVTASPSIIQPGTKTFGYQSRPKTRSTNPGMPPAVSRWRMWTNSCSTIASIQARSSASSEVAAGGTA
ncbi:MAG: hypothetical protein QM704_19255 [Anaeromyxobacteraceae bacterium]